MSRFDRRLPIGAEVQPDGSTHFRVWAPEPKEVLLVIEPCRDQPKDVAMTPEPDGYYSVVVADVGHGHRYRFKLDGELAADPASRFQPEGPSGPSQVIDPGRYRWSDHEWRGLPPERRVVYELHVGTFTPEGTWRAAIEKLPMLARLGISMIEVMPVSEFPGRFGWGYDGVLPYAPTRLYGDPDDFRAFVDAAHRLGTAVILDVVYNHLGPDGCVFSRFSPQYFTDRYDNEWGDALNFDDTNAGGAREYWSWNGAYWISEFHLDGLRLDATQSVHDESEEHILASIAARARLAAPERRLYVVAENEPQHVQLVRSTNDGGYGLDALWNDDFHHSAIVALTGRREAYYSDHTGAPQEFVSAAKYGYLFQGQRYGWQKRPRGTPTLGLKPAAFVNFIENHDQVANSGDGSRVRARTSPGRYRAMTALMLLMPGTPMLFQGQEFGATTPFLYFADHKPELAAQVRKGRAEFVKQFPTIATNEMTTRVPPPDAEATFRVCKLDWAECDRHDSWRRLHADLIALRLRAPAFAPASQADVDGAVLGPEAFAIRFFSERDDDERLLLVNLGLDIARPSFAEPLLAPPAGCTWRLEWSSEAPEYGGSGTPDVIGSDGWNVLGHAAMVLRPEKSDGGDGTTRH
jgi:maltooligosyltrehalose trehalohydrolase